MKIDFYIRILCFKSNIRFFMPMKDHILCNKKASPKQCSLYLFAKIGFFNAVVIHQFVGIAVKHDLARFKYIGTVGDGKGFLCVLLNKQDSGAAFTDLADDVEYLVYIKR